MLELIGAGIFQLMLMAPALAQSCEFLVGTVSFGQVNLLNGGAVDSAVAYRVNCENSSSATRHCLSIGPGSYGDSTGRQMGSGSNRLRYEFYSDAARTQRWGSYETGFAGGVGQQVDVPSRGNIYGFVYVRILPNQQAVPASSTSYDDLTFANVGTRYRSTSLNCPFTGGATYTHVNLVQATVPANCNVSVSTLNFGSAGQLANAVDSTSTIFVQCTNTTPYTVSLNGGVEANINARRMASGGNRIGYQLYRDAARSQVWGSTSGATASGTGTGISQPLTVYGRVPAQTTPAAGNYSDTILVTVTY